MKTFEQISTAVAARPMPKPFATEVDVPIDTPVIFRDAEGIQVSGEEISFLEGLAEFKE